jgi:polysaccharide chain length determinant protein (PEP-CTERM system associated)
MKDLKNLDPLGYLQIIWRRRWYALTAFILIAGGICSYARWTPNVYRSEARLAIEPAMVPRDYVRPSEITTPEEQIGAVRQHIQSRRFMEQMIQEFQLFGYGGQDFSMDLATEAVGKSIQVLSTSKNTFTIAYSANDASFAQNFTKRIVETLIQTSSASRKEKAVEADQFLDEQLRQAVQDLAANGEKIKQFKLTHLGALPEQSMANLNALTGLNTRLAGIESSLQSVRDQQKLLDISAQQHKKLGLLTQSLLLPSPDASSANITPANTVSAHPLLIKKEAELASLRTRLTAKHPEVMRVAREIEEIKQHLGQEGGSASNESQTLSPLGDVKSPTENSTSKNTGNEANAIFDMEAAQIEIQVQANRNEIAKYDKEKASILAQISAYQAKLNLAPAIEQELTVLSREHAVLEQQYENLQNKKFQAQMTTNLEANKNSDAYRIIDEANLPDKPAFPNRVQLMLMGLGAGFVIGLGAAFGRELLDATLSSEDEVVAVVKIPVLVSISEMPRKEPKRLIRMGRTAKSA